MSCKRISPKEIINSNFSHVLVLSCAFAGSGPPQGRRSGCGERARGGGGAEELPVLGDGTTVFQKLNDMNLYYAVS